MYWNYGLAKACFVVCKMYYNTFIKRYKIARKPNAEKKKNFERFILYSERFSWLSYYAMFWPILAIDLAIDIVLCVFFVWDLFFALNSQDDSEDDDDDNDTESLTL